MVGFAVIAGMVDRCGKINAKDEKASKCSTLLAVFD